MTTAKKPGRILVALLGVAIALSAFALPAFAETVDTGSTDASVTFTAGELKLNNVPTLDFGTQAVAATEQNYTAGTVTSVTQVSDLRGNGKGWDLHVALSPFKLDGTETETLQAASINVAGYKVSAVNGSVGTPPTATDGLSIPSDGTETPVLKAGAQAGMGVWNLEWNANDVSLNVKPGTAQKGSNVATMNWSLQSTPRRITTPQHKEKSIDTDKKENHMDRPFGSGPACADVFGRTRPVGAGRH